MQKENDFVAGTEYENCFFFYVLLGLLCARDCNHSARLGYSFLRFGQAQYVCVFVFSNKTLIFNLLFVSLLIAIQFQENLLKTLLQIEDCINETVRFYHNELNKNCIIIYDRGAMDPVAYLEESDWETLKQRNPSWNEVLLFKVSSFEGKDTFWPNFNFFFKRFFWKFFCEIIVFTSYCNLVQFLKNDFFPKTHYFEFGQIFLARFVNCVFTFTL